MPHRLSGEVVKALWGFFHCPVSADEVLEQGLQ